jgi:hypothetical protein
MARITILDSLILLQQVLLFHAHRTFFSQADEIRVTGAAFLADTKPWSAPLAAVGGETIANASVVAACCVGVFATGGFSVLRLAKTYQKEQGKQHLEEHTSWL